MNTLPFRTLLLSAVAFLFLFQGTLDSGPGGLTPRMSADYIHAVIQADRTIYSQHIVDRLDKKIGLKATENWQSENTLLLPAQFLLKSSEISNASGIGLRYYLMSLWPINPNNSQQSETQRMGLHEVAKNPEEPFSWIVQTDGIWYYQAIYPDIAISEACVTCHNSHPNSPRKDFQLGDVMGGILINLPIGKHGNKADVEKHLFTPEVVSDYVHAILEADRTVYSRYIVDRLQEKNIVRATEHWQEENALPLPAQFLLNASRWVREHKFGMDFRLVSQWPINPNNGVTSEFERKGLEAIEIHPVRPYAEKSGKGRNRHFKTIYPDFAITSGCIQCHNTHPQSPKRDFKLKDVMGGIVVTLDLG